MDAETRDLERRALEGDRAALERLKATWLRTRGEEVETILEIELPPVGAFRVDQSIALSPDVSVMFDVVTHGKSYKMSVERRLGLGWIVFREAPSRGLTAPEVRVTGPAASAASVSGFFGSEA